MSASQPVSDLPEQSPGSGAPPARRSFPFEEARFPWLSMLLDAYHTTDQGVAEGIRREQAQGRRLACARGCAACCRSHTTIPVYPLELIGMTWYATEQVQGPVRERLKQQLRDHRARPPALETTDFGDGGRRAQFDTIHCGGPAPIAETAFASPIGPRRGERGMDAPSASSGTGARPGCPFLIDEACAIHPMRPMACRQFNVFDRVCAEGEDAYYTRRADVLTPIKRFSDDAFYIMMPFYGVRKNSERRRAVKEGRMHALARVLRELNWESVASKMDEFDRSRPGE